MKKALSSGGRAFALDLWKSRDTSGQKTLEIALPSVEGRNACCGRFPGQRFIALGLGVAWRTRYSTYGPVVKVMRGGGGGGDV